MTIETQQDLDEWANNITQLEPEVVKGILSWAKELTGDKRLQKSDRDFAQTQVAAIERAKRRKRHRLRKTLEGDTNS